MRRGVIFLVILAVFSGIVSAQNCAEDQIIFKLSGNTNAHAEVYSGENYPVSVCYNEIFGKLGGGDRDCGAGDESLVLRLSSNSNAHAEDPMLSNYDIKVCYTGLRCSLKQSCSAGEKLVVGLSGATNAHLEISASGSYSGTLCCSEGSQTTEACNDGIDNDGDSLIDLADSGCVDIDDTDEFNDNLVTEVYWADKNGVKLGDGAKVFVTDSVKLVARGIPDNSEVVFTIEDKDILFRDLFPSPSDEIKIIKVNSNGGIATTPWTITKSDYSEGNDLGEIDPLELYFTAVSGSYNIESKELKVSEKGIPPPEPTPEPLPENSCGSYTSLASCIEDVNKYSKIKNNEYVLLDCDHNECSCGWNINSNSANPGTDGKCVLKKDVYTTGPGGQICSGRCIIPDYTSSECSDGKREIKSEPQLLTSGECTQANIEQLKIQSNCLPVEYEISCGVPQLKLPFFDRLQFITASAVIMVIYILLMRRR